MNRDELIDFGEHPYIRRGPTPMPQDDFDDRLNISSEALEEIRKWQCSEEEVKKIFFPNAYPSGGAYISEQYPFDRVANKCSCGRAEICKTESSNIKSVDGLMENDWINEFAGEPKFTGTVKRCDDCSGGTYYHSCTFVGDVSFDKPLPAGHYRVREISDSLGEEKSYLITKTEWVEGTSAKPSVYPLCNIAGEHSVTPPIDWSSIQPPSPIYFDGVYRTNFDTGGAFKDGVSVVCKGE